MNYIVYNILVDASIRLNTSEIRVSEEDADADLCVLVTSLPSEGIESECEIKVTLGFTAVSACKCKVAIKIITFHDTLSCSTF